MTEPWLGKHNASGKAEGKIMRVAGLFHAPMHPRIHFFARDHPPRRGGSEYETGAKRPMQAVRVSSSLSSERPSTL